MPPGENPKDLVVDCLRDAYPRGFLHLRRHGLVGPGGPSEASPETGFREE